MSDTRDLQNFLASIVNLGAPLHTEGNGEWYAVVVNDPDELGHPKTLVGIQVKIDGQPGNYRVTGTGSYNR